jgi:cell division protein FtsB
MKFIGAGRTQFSVRSLLITTAVLGFSLAPVVWVTRERRQMLRAREEAIRSVILAERRRVELRAKGGQNGASTDEFGPDANQTSIPVVPPEVLIEHLRRENDELKDTVDSLRHEVERLRAANRR